MINYIRYRKVWGVHDMHDGNFENLMKNIMNDTKKRKYRDKQEKLMRKYYGLLNTSQSATDEGAKAMVLKGIGDLSIRGAQKTNSNYTKSQSELRQKLVSEVNKKNDNNK